MPDIEPVIELKRLFEAHGISCTVEDQWVVPNNTLPAIRALWYPRETSGRLEIHALLKDDVVIEECFAGLGDNDKAFADAFQNFMINSFHVLLAALWDKNDPEQVMTERWSIGGREFTAFIGNFGMRGSNGVCAKIPNELFPAIESAVKQATLQGDTHWVRTFFCNLNEEQTYEALMDNEDWELGISCLKKIPWEKCDGYYSVRNFLLLRAA